MRKTTNIKKEFKEGFDYGFKKGYEKGYYFVSSKLENYELNYDKFINRTKALYGVLGLWVAYSVGKRGLKGHFKFAYSKSGHKKIFLLCALLESIVLLTSIERGDE